MVSIHVFIRSTQILAKWYHTCMHWSLASFDVCKATIHACIVCWAERVPENSVFGRHTHTHASIENTNKSSHGGAPLSHTTVVCVRSECFRSISVPLMATAAKLIRHACDVWPKSNTKYTERKWKITNKNTTTTLRLPVFSYKISCYTAGGKHLKNGSLLVRYENIN